MEYTVTCRGKEYVTGNEDFYKWAMELDDNGLALGNPRFKFLLNNHMHFKVKGEAEVALRRQLELYPLLHEVRKMYHSLSDEDEAELDEAMGNDPMCMF